MDVFWMAGTNQDAIVSVAQGSMATVDEMYVTMTEYKYIFFFPIPNSNIFAVGGPERLFLNMSGTWNARREQGDVIKTM